MRLSTGEPSTLDPVISSTAYDFSVEEAIFDGLLKYDDRAGLIPDLALEVPSRANGGISADMKTVTYHLRRGVTWQDGHPFTSRDVAFTYRLLMDDKVASPLRSTYDSIVSLQTPSPYTVVVHLRKPSISTIGQIFVAGTGFIVPEHVLRNVENIRQSDFNSNPIGTGPFTVLRWKRGDRVDLVANEHYFLGPPHVRRVDLLVVPSEATRVAMLKTGALDVASVKHSDAQSLASAKFRIFGGRAPNVFYVDLNTRKAPLDQRAVREALANAVDRSLLIRSMRGRVEPATSLIPQPFAGPAEKADIKKADGLLRSAGWIMGTGGIRSRNGTALRIELSYAAGPFYAGTALQLQQAWRNIGVDTTLRAMPYGALFGDRGLVVEGRYDASIDGMGVNDPIAILPVIGSSSTPPAGANYSGYANPRVDRWLQMADATEDARVRSRLYARVDRTLREDSPVIPLFWDSYTEAVNRRVRGFAPEPIVSDLWNVASWSVRSETSARTR